MANKVTTKPNQTLLASESVEPKSNLKLVETYTVSADDRVKCPRGAVQNRPPQHKYSFQTSSFLETIALYEGTQKNDFYLTFMMVYLKTNSRKVYEYQGNKNTPSHYRSIVEADLKKLGALEVLKHLNIDEKSAVEMGIPLPSPGALYNELVKGSKANPTAYPAADRIY
jgi:hypothetical protein